MVSEHFRNNRIPIYSWVFALLVHMLVLFASCSQSQSDAPVSLEPMAVRLESYHDTRCEKIDQKVEEQKKQAQKPKKRVRKEPKKKVQEVVEPVLDGAQEPVENTLEEQETVAEEAVEECAPSSAAAARRSADNLYAALRREIEKKKFYPYRSRSMREEGTVVVRLALRADGSIGALSVLRSSGHASLDWAAKKAVKDADPLPAPSDYGLHDQTISVPLNYSLY